MIFLSKRWTEKKVHPHWEDGPAFENLDWAALGVSQPENLLWWGIVYHLDKTTDWVRDLSKPCPNPKITDEDRVALFLLVLSDHLAATAGRVLRKGAGGTKRTTVHRLWNPKYADALPGKPEPINDAVVLADVLKQIQANNAAKLFARFRQSMEIKPEDETVPRNVTSLLSHSLLVGQFYRILRRNVTIQTAPLRLCMAGKVVQTTEDAKQQWKLHSLRATLRFHQNPVRPADLNVFSRLNQVSKQLRQRFTDEVLFQTSDSVWLVLPYDTSDDAPEALDRKLREAFAPVLEEHFYLEIEIKTAPLKELGVWLPQAAQQELVRRFRVGVQDELAQAQQQITIQMERIKKLDEQRIALRRQMAKVSDRVEHGKKIQEADRAVSNVQRQLQELRQTVAALEGKIAQPAALVTAGQYNNVALYPQDVLQSISFPPPLCEICQMRPAREREFANVIDYVCDVCDGIRTGGFRQRSIDDWDLALWVKVNLQAQALESALVQLFADYVEAKAADAGQRADCLQDIRIAAIARDFVEDYRAFLADWDTKLRELAWRENGNPELRDLETADLRVLRIRDGAQLYQILNAFRVLCKMRFPVLFEQDARVSPIRLGISIADPKYPFYQHWRYISAPPAPVAVRIVSKRPLEVGLAALDHLADLNLSERDREVRRGRSYLHKLARIERRSGSTALATVTLLSDEHDRRKPIPRVLEVFAELIEKRVLRMSDLLAYEHLTTFGVE
jgi:hypothetical protein